MGLTAATVGPGLAPVPQARGGSKGVLYFTVSSETTISSRRCWEAGNATNDGAKNALSLNCGSHWSCLITSRGNLAFFGHIGRGRKENAKMAHQIRHTAHLQGTRTAGRAGAERLGSNQPCYYTYLTRGPGDRSTSRILIN